MKITEQLLEQETEDIFPDESEESSGLPALLEQPGRVELKTQFVELRARGWSY